jgi:hypothetical protein
MQPRPHVRHHIPIWKMVTEYSDRLEESGIAELSWSCGDVTGMVRVEVRHGDSLALDRSISRCTLIY